MAFDSNNRITALKVDTIANLGAYMSLFSSCVPTYLYATLLSGQYAIPAIHANVRTVYTNTAPVDAYRGAGRPEATYLLERTIETAARELGLSPAELRRINFIRNFPHQTPVIMTLLDDFSVADPTARLWPQTEWLKASIRFAALTEGAERERYLASAARAATALQHFLDVPVRGLWRDKQKADGSFVEEPAPASTFYHILCAIYELEDCLKRM